MSRISRSDLHGVLGLVHELAQIEDPAQFPTLMLEGIAKLIPSEVLCYDELGPQGQQLLRRHLPVDAVPDREEEACQRLSLHNPLVSHFVFNGSGPALRLSDIVSQRQFRDLDVYCDCYRFLGWEHQMIAVLPAGTGLRGVTFNRKSRDFSERDRALADLVRYHLAYAQQRVNEGAELKNRLHILELALDGESTNGARIGSLTRREMAVLELVAQGLTNREIAERLFTSDRTVQKHLEHVYYKLGVHTRTAAARKLISN
jgi:DNA-binding CsgD family transcriptional regulator